MIVKTAKGNVRVNGINFIKSDSIYANIKYAFEHYDTEEKIASYIRGSVGQPPRNVFLKPEMKVVFTSF